MDGPRSTAISLTHQAFVQKKPMQLTLEYSADTIKLVVFNSSKASVEV